MKRAYTHAGKQVLMNGFTFADCITEEAARRIAEALTGSPTWRGISQKPPEPMAVLVYFGGLGPFVDWEGNPVAAEPYREAAERTEVGFWDGRFWRESGTAHDMFEPWRGVLPTHWQPLETPPIPADASTPSAGARNATRSVPGVGGSL